MKQTYKLRYMIPKLNLNTKPANDQEYSVYIAEYDSYKKSSFRVFSWYRFKAIYYVYSQISQHSYAGR